jgi:hypothetical protein
VSHDTRLHASSKAAQMRAVKSSKAGTQEREGEGKLGDGAEVSNTPDCCGGNIRCGSNMSSKNLGDGAEVSHDTRLHASLLQREVDALPPAICVVISVVI